MATQASERKTGSCAAINFAPFYPMKFYLWLNAFLYAVLAIWCTVQHTKTASGTGYTGLDNSGHSEYLVIYGGLQLGLVAIYAYLATKPEYLRLGVLLSIFLYTPIVIYRIITVIKYDPVSPITLGTSGLEVALLLAAIGLWFGKRV